MGTDTLSAEPGVGRESWVLQQVPARSWATGFQARYPYLGTFATVYLLSCPKNLSESLQWKYFCNCPYYMDH